MKDVQEEQPNRFGPNDKMSSAYSLTNFTWNLGLLIGPIISGSLTRAVGYYYMNLVIGTSIPPQVHPFQTFPYWRPSSILEIEQEMLILTYVSYNVLYCWNFILGFSEQQIIFVLQFVSSLTS